MMPLFYVARLRNKCDEDGTREQVLLSLSFIAAQESLIHSCPLLAFVIYVHSLRVQCAGARV
jgi:hypothetical protein